MATTTETQKQCPDCARRVDVTTLICPYCGHVFLTTPVATTRSLEDQDTAEMRASRWGNSRLGQRMQLVLRVMHDNAVYAFDPTQIEVISLGRRDPRTSELPTLDLEPHNGDELGVSRRHAHIRLMENNSLNILDQGSVNGTYLNGQRLIPHQPRILRDDDEVRVGRLILRVAFVPLEGE